MTSSEDDSVENESFQSKNSSALNNPVIRLKVFFFYGMEDCKQLVTFSFTFLKKSIELLSVMVQRTALKRISDLLAGSHYMARNYLTVTREDFETLIVSRKCSSCSKSDIVK